MNEFYTVKEVALMSGLTERTIRHYIQLGALKGNKTDGIWKFTPKEVDAFFRTLLSSRVFSQREMVSYPIFLWTGVHPKTISALFSICPKKPEIKCPSTFAIFIIREIMVKSLNFL